jgi:tripartite-type tricarboxylate transporter receptor subunit TctC
VTPHVKAGKVKALAVTGAKRSQLMPGLPTISESGLPGYDASGWYGLFVPAPTPRTVVTRLNAEAVKALRLPDVVRTLSSQGAEPVANSPEEFGAFVRAEIEKWARLVKLAKMKAD